MGWDAISKVVINGNVGIGTTNPSYMLDVYTDNTSINNAFVLGQIQHVKHL